jgi:hypothetical protein
MVIPMSKNGNGNKGFYGLAAAIVAGLVSLASKDKLPTSLCIFQVGSCGGAVHINSSPTPSPSPSSLSSSRLDSRNEYLKQIKALKANLSAIDPNAALKFPLGTEYPFKSSIAAVSSPTHEVVAYVDGESGKVKDITSKELLKLVEEYASPLYDQIAGAVPVSQNTLLALDLVVVASDGSVKTLNSVDGGDFLRDLLNASLTSRLQNFSPDTIEHAMLNR